MTETEFTVAFLDYLEKNGTQDAYHLLQRLESALDNKCDSGVCSRCGDTSSGYSCICYAR